MNKYFSLLLSLITLIGCNPVNHFSDYYYEHKEDLNDLKSISYQLTTDYNFNYISVMNTNDQIKFAIHDEHPFKGTAQYYDKNSLLPLPISIYDGKSICDSCSVLEIAEYQKILNEPNLQKLLKQYKRIDTRAIKIIPDGVFIAVGKPNKNKNRSGTMEGGIFLPFTNSFDKGQIVCRISNEDAFLYETIVR